MSRSELGALIPFVVRQHKVRLILYAGTLAVVVALAACTNSANTPGNDSTAMALKVEQLEAKVSYLQDRQQIHDMYLHYMRGFDRNDTELMRSAFWPEVQINYASQSNTLDEFIERHLAKHTKNLSTWGHLITNESVEIRGDTAHAEVYVTALFTHHKDRESEAWVGGATIIAGRYIDRIERRNGEWRIAVREFIPHFVAKTQPVGDLAHSSDCSMGTWDRRDPSYRRPLTARVNKGVGPECAE